MINPTARDIDRKVVLVVPFKLEGKSWDSGRIAGFAGDWVTVTLDGTDSGAFHRDELEWFSGKDRA